MSKEKYEFQAEVGKILRLVASSLYSDKEIFLREYISNASDACDKLRYEILKDPKLSKTNKFEINLNLDKKNKSISVSDNGIGMNKEELINSLGTIAKSGTEEFIKKLEKEKNSNIDQIGKFGVGFYSGFMVAKTIKVITKKAGTKETWQWVSDGKGSFEIEKSNEEISGTKIILNLNDKEVEFLEKLRVENIVKKYSDHITYPVFIEETSEKTKSRDKINEGQAIWTKDKKSIKKEEYEKFYTSVSLNYDKPWSIIHNTIEGTINFTNLVFIPSEKPFDILNTENKKNLKLYVKKVFVTESCEDILPKYLRFVTGIVDSEDISLNISREMLQNDPIINKIKNNLTKKILSSLKESKKKEADNFKKFWLNFGSVLKEGIHEDFTNKDEILDISLFRSSQEKDWTDLDGYIKRSKKNQKEIFYISGDDKDKLINSPQMETFIKNDIEVLFFTDPVDEFWLPNIEKYKEFVFKSITKGDVDITKYNNVNNDDKKETKNNKEKTSKLVAYLKTFYGDKVKDVRVSSRLTESPVCFIAGENEMDIHLENMLKKHKHLETVTSKILEINPDHEIIKFLSNLDTTKDYNKKIISDTSLILLDQAKIAEGIPLEDSKSFCNNINSMLSNKLKGFK